MSWTFDRLSRIYSDKIRPHVPDSMLAELFEQCIHAAHNANHNVPSADGKFHGDGLNHDVRFNQAVARLDKYAATLDSAQAKKPSFESKLDYGRFTDRARKVIQLANAAALRLNHGYLGVEHILLGILEEDGGIAASVLRRLHCDFRKVRDDIEASAGPPPRDGDIVGRLPLTLNTRRVIATAIEQASVPTDRDVCTEHLLLGLGAVVGDFCARPGFRVLAAGGVHPREIIAELRALLGDTTKADHHESAS